MSFANLLDAFEDEAAGAVDVSPTRATVDAFENDAERQLDFDERGERLDRRATTSPNTTVAGRSVTRQMISLMLMKSFESKIHFNHTRL